MAKKPQKPDSRNNDKKTKPNKDRAFLFGSKKWSADEYFGGEDDFDFIKENGEVSSNNSYFADDEESSSKRKSITPSIAREAVLKENSNFISNKETSKENNVSLPFDAEKIDEKVIAEEFEEKSEAKELIFEEEPKQKLNAEASDNNVTKRRKRKSYAGLLNKIEDVEFEETELPEEILSEEVFVEEAVEEIEAPKERRGLFARFEKDEEALADEVTNDETYQDNPIPKKKAKGLFSRKNKEKTEETFAEDELNETADEAEISQDNSQEEKTRARRKDHSSLLASLGELEFEETELPDEILTAEAAVEETTEAQAEPNEERTSLFASFGKDNEELVDDVMNDETTDQESPIPKKKARGLFSRKDKEKTEESFAEDELNEDLVEDNSQEEKTRARRKDHSSLLASLGQVEFEETELPQEILTAEAASEDTAETQEEPSEKRKGLFARFEEQDAEKTADEFVDAIEEDDKPEKTKKRSFLSHFLKDEEPNNLLDNDEVKQDEAPLPFEEEIVSEPQEKFEDIQEKRISSRRKDHSNLLTSLNEVTFDETDVPEEVLIEEASQENEETVEQPKKRRGLFVREESEAEDYLKTDEIVEDADTNKKEKQEEKQLVKPKRVDDGLMAAAETFYFAGRKKTDSSIDEKINDVEDPAKSQPDTEIKGTVDEEFSSELSLDVDIEEKTDKPIAEEKKLSWFRRFFYRDVYDEELIEEEDIIEEDKSLNTIKKRSGLSAYFYNDDEFDETAIEDNAALEQLTEQKTESRRSKTVQLEENNKEEDAILVAEDFAEETQLEEPRGKRRGLLARTEETDELEEFLSDDEDVFSAPKRSRSKKKHRDQRVSTKQVDLQEIETDEEDKPAVKPAAASISSLQEEEIEPKKRTRKPVGRRDNSFSNILAAIKNILPNRKSDNKALTFAEVNKHNKKIKTRRIFIYAGTGILAVAVALVLIFVPLGKPVDTQPDDTMVAISDPVETDEPTQQPTTIPTTEPSPTQQVVQTPIVTTQPDPTHRTINIDKMVDDFKVEADLYYNKAGYSTNYYKYTENEMYILAQLIHGEARGESMDGMVAVGNVVMNRVLNRRVFGNDIKSVVTAAHQFSGYKSTIVPSSKCKIAARKVLDFQVWVVPQNVYYFKAYGSVGTNWGSHKYYTKIGGHYFYTHRYGGRSNTDKRPPRLFERTYMWPRMGCKPEDRVYMIQYMLNGLGYDVKADSYFGEGTKEELKKFQQKKGLDSDGVAGPSTIEALIRAYGIEDFYDKFYT